MASVELNINGRFYSVACDAGEEERVTQLSRMIDEKARLLGASASDAQRFLMVALMLADELDEMRVANVRHGTARPGPDEDRDLLVAAVDHLAERIDHIAAALAQG